MDNELIFERSSYCANSCCLEVAMAPHSEKVYVRNSKNPGTYMAFSTEEWRAFVDGVKSNEFDL